MSLVKSGGLEVPNSCGVLDDRADLWWWGKKWITCNIYIGNKNCLVEVLANAKF